MKIYAVTKQGFCVEYVTGLFTTKKGAINSAIDHRNNETDTNNLPIEVWKYHGIHK